MQLMQQLGLGYTPAPASGVLRLDSPCPASLPSRRGGPATPLAAAALAHPAAASALDKSCDELMCDPVVASDGHSYERAAIQGG